VGSRRSRPGQVTAAGLFTLAQDCQHVIVLRLARIALGGRAGEREVGRMIVEKVATAVAANAAAASAILRRPDRAADEGFSAYRTAVTANLRRLGRSQ